jgi:TatD DNase family protein
VYLDAHNHLHDATLRPHLGRIAGQLARLGLKAAVVNGTCEDDWPAVSRLARQHPWVQPSYGVHPWDAGNRSPAWMGRLRQILLEEPGAAVGEIGIDRWMTDAARPADARLLGLRRAPLTEQIEVFLEQYALARELDRPATLHCLQAWGALDDLLRSNPAPARGFLLHAYSGPREMVRSFAEQGAYFSFNGGFLDPRKEAIRDAFRSVPADRLLVETDAPAMLPPTPWRTHRLPPAPDGTALNHPGNIEAAYAGLAALRGLPVADLAAQVATNFKRLFGAGAG